MIVVLSLICEAEREPHREKAKEREISHPLRCLVYPQMSTTGGSWQLRTHSPSPTLVVETQLLSHPYLYL